MATQAPRRSRHKADWHPADIVAALRKAGWSLRSLSVHHGYIPQQLSAAVSRPWPKGERLIAEAIGESAENIWPSRYEIRAQREARYSEKTRANRARRQASAGAVSVLPMPSVQSLDNAA